MHTLTPITLRIVRTTLGICLLTGMADSVQAEDYALTVYGGRVTEERFMEALTLNVNFLDAYVVVGALAWTMAHLYDGALTLEIEGQVAKYYGNQEHFELNLPVAARWHKFAWNRTVATSIAFGLGPSWATEVPEVELVLNNSSQQFLVYWFLEFAFGPPDTDWAMVFRLHHRSTGYGLVAENGGANTLAAGLKFRF